MKSFKEALNEIKPFVPVDESFHNPYQHIFGLEETERDLIVILGDTEEQTWKLRLKKDTVLLGRIVSLAQDKYKEWTATLEGGYQLGLEVINFGKLSEVTAEEEWRRSGYSLYIRLAEAGYIRFADSKKLKRLLEAEERLWEARRIRTSLIKELGGETCFSGSYEDYDEWWEIPGVPFSVSKD